MTTHDRLVVSGEQLRRGSHVLRDGSGELHKLATRVRGRAIPQLPPSIAHRFATELDEIGIALGASWSPFVTYAKELKVRALWAEIADARADHRSLSDAQLREVFALMKDGSLLRWATDRQARWAGRTLGTTYRKDFEDPQKLAELVALLRENAHDADFAGGFLSTFGAKNLAEIPRVIQAIVDANRLAGPAADGDPQRHDIAAQLLASQPGYSYGGDPVKDLLAPFTQALAVATSAGTLSRDRQRELARDPDSWAFATLLSDPGTYGKGFLLDAFRSGVVDRIVAENQGAAPVAEPGLGGLPADSKVTILDALSRNPDAAAAAFTHELPKLELHGPDGAAATVTDPVELMLGFGTYGDEGHALGEASASAVAGLHHDHHDAAANGITNRLVDEVIRGRDDLGGIRDGVARVVATPDVMDDLHRIAAGGNASPDYDPDHDGVVGASNADRLRLSSSQVGDLLGKLSEGDVARERLLDGVSNYQVHEIRDGSGDGGRRAHEIASFNRLLVEAVDRADEPVAEPPVAAQPEPPAAPEPPVVPEPAPAPVPATPPVDAAPDAGASPQPEQRAPAVYGAEPAYEIVDHAAWDDDGARELRQRIEVAVVSGFYENGELGTQHEIRLELRHLEHEPGFHPKPFFDGHGHLLSYDAMDRDQRWTFEEWLETDRVQAVVGDALESVEDGAETPLD